MKIVDIYDNQDLSLYEKAAAAWELWDKTESFLDDKPVEEQELYREKIQHTLDMCVIMYSNVSVEERDKIAEEYEAIRVTL